MSKNAVISLFYFSCLFFATSCSAQSNAISNDDLEGIIISANKGNPISQYQLALSYDEGNNVSINHEKAVQWYEKAAKQGHVSAQYNLAVSYDYGEGVKQNKQKAFKWYLKAANKGHLNAQNNLAAMYEAGEGTKVNLAEAIKWYEKSAKKGNAISQYNLGELYAKGSGEIKMDLIKAYAWLKLADKNGNKESNQEIQIITPLLKEKKQLPRAEQLAKEYLSTYQTSVKK